MLIQDKVFYVGVNDRTKHKFEGLWPLPIGVSYNSYLIADDDAVALIDTVDVAFFSEYINKIQAVIGNRPIDYLIINHMEPDHSGAIALIRKYYPGIKLVGNKKTLEMVQGFYGVVANDDVCVADGETISLGKHQLKFYLTPMLHWPETMMTYDETNKMLFSGDAFGCFGALNGQVIDSKMDVSPYWPEMERYYACILGKFGAPVQAGLKKLAGVDIKTICSTHGPIWTQHIPQAIDTYKRLATGETQQGLVICYGSMYGNTERVAEAIAQGAAEAGMRKIIVHNLSVSDMSDVLADIFRYNTLAIGGPTYNGGLFPAVDDLMKRLAGRSVSKHKLALFGGFTWSSQAVKVMQAYNEKMKMELVGTPVEWKQGAHADALQQAQALGKLLVD
ncbi:MAG: FprA family A-type flavoprotein [Prevotella sp.]|nr:FprA family A-type flavoprotein [Prevotella sp.]MDY5666893.1 FprA family A-type flavoprotein [Alloprevotella sp.]